MLVILPFEKSFYEKWDYAVEYVGHPLVEVIENFIDKYKQIENNWPFEKTIALLPGSRKQEILQKLPIMLEVTKHFKDYQFVVAKAPSVDDSFYSGILNIF